MNDILIKNGLIVDGTGNTPYKGNIVINKGKITHITSTHSSQKAVLEIAADEKIIAPGFIDISNHSDTYLTLFSMPSQKSLVTQGITTLLGGNCGSSLAPLVGNNAIESIQKWTNMRDININWRTVSEYISVLKKRSLGVNVATLIGYATVRRGIVGDEPRALSDMEQTTILHIIDTALKDGALGVSLGLAFSHMQMIDRGELLQLAKLLKKHNKLLTSHTRNDGEHVVEAIQEIIDIVELTKVKTHINHIKVLGHKNWKYHNEVNMILHKAEAKKLPLTFDIFPYTANNTVAYILLPSWVSLGGKSVLLENLKDMSIRLKVIQEMKANSYDYNRMIVSDSPMNKSILGKSIVEIAKNQGLGVEDALIQLIIASEGRARVIVEAISESHMKELIHFSNSVIGSDAAGYDDTLIHDRGYEHPRSFGAMPKFLQDFVVSGDMSWQEGIRKLTGLTAEIMGIEDRGLLKENMRADVVIIDPKRINSCATFQQPIQYSQGIDTVIINGQSVLSQGEVSLLAGEVIIG